MWQIFKVIKNSLIIGVYLWVSLWVFVVVKLVSSTQVVVDKLGEYYTVGAYLMEVLVVCHGISGQ